MTSLIDVIFLLLLFFMLSSTFTRFAEIPLVSASAGQTAPGPQGQVLFLRMGDARLDLNGESLDLAALPERLRAQAEPGQKLLVAPTESASAQRLVDVLVALSSVPDLSVTVLE